VNNLSVLAPYLQARQKRVSGLQRLLEQQQEYGRQRGLVDYRATLEQQAEERKRRAMESDPYQKARLTEILTRIKNMQTPEQEYSDWQRKEKWRRAHPFPARGRAGGPAAGKVPPDYLLKLVTGGEPDWRAANRLASEREELGAKSLRMPEEQARLSYLMSPEINQQIYNVKQGAKIRVAQQMTGLGGLLPYMQARENQAESLISALESDQISQDDFAEGMYDLWQRKEIDDTEFEQATGYSPYVFRPRRAAGNALMGLDSQ
jgi:hypothetical protein